MEQTSLHATTIDPGLLSPGAATTEPAHLEPVLCIKRSLHSEKPAHLEPVLCNKRSPPREKPTHHSYRVAPIHRSQRKSRNSNEDLAQPKISK